MRVGMGYDVHKLVEGRKLILGGVEIPYEKGLLGHSDADVMLHAVMDALLGTDSVYSATIIPVLRENYNQKGKILLFQSPIRFL